VSKADTASKAGDSAHGVMPWKLYFEEEMVLSGPQPSFKSL